LFVSLIRTDDQEKRHASGKLLLLSLLSGVRGVLSAAGGLKKIEPLRREGRQGFSFSLIGTDDQEK